MHKPTSTACRLAVLLLSCAATGCATNKPAPPDFCATAHPIYVSKDDVLTEDTAKMILRHNRTGRGICGW